MTTSRAESQHSFYGRRRSNTSTSIIRTVPPPAPTPTPLQIGDSRILHAWVHDVKDSPNIILNHTHCPGVAEGDLLRVTVGSSSKAAPGFLFKVPRDEGARSQLQISIPKPTADAFDIRNNAEVTLIKVEPHDYIADHVELVFQDQYLGRNDMWRLAEHITGQCVFSEQEITFIGGMAAKIQGIFIEGKPVASALMTPSTKTTYRSLSAKVTIFIQVCKELWEFSGDGERYYEKIVHSFLPALFAKWREAGTNHTVTIVLISRVYYEESEVDYAAGPLRRDERGNWYKDFYKVITDLEVNNGWKVTLIDLKNSFWKFQRDILLAHHFHRATNDPKIGTGGHVRLVGQLSYAQDGPILEALHLNLNPTESHYIDRSLSLTGTAFILITPGTGYFRVPKQLLRLTTTRMLDQGVVLNVVLLTKQPLHQSPIFSFQGAEPEPSIEDDEDDPFANDPLWCDDSKADPNKRKTFWWEPFWLSTTWWDKQQDLPFRQDRFIPRAKMHEIQMLGLLEHDVLSSIEVPFLPERPLGPLQSPESSVISKEDADKFDNDIFTRPETLPGIGPFSIGPSKLGFPSKKAYPNSQYRSSITSSRHTISEESPRKILKDLPDDGLPPLSALAPPPSASVISTSPQPSVRSLQTTRSTSSVKTETRAPTASKSLAAKLTNTWLFNTFSRSGVSEPQTTPLAVGASTSAHASPVGSVASTPAIKSKALPTPISTLQPPKSSTSVATTPMTPSAPIRMPLPSARATTANSTHGVAEATKGSLGRSSVRFERDRLAAPSTRNSFTRRSPITISPLDDSIYAHSSKRRSAGSLMTSLTSGSPRSQPNPSNPSQPQRPVSYLQSSMARRWRHIFPFPLKKHDIKWKAMVTPACFPLTVDYFPSPEELQKCYQVFQYDFVVDSNDLKSFLVRSPNVKGTPQEEQAAAALAIMRGMAAVRLAQGFQFVLKEEKQDKVKRNMEYPRKPMDEFGGSGKWDDAVRKAPKDKFRLKRTSSFLNGEEPVGPTAIGATDVLKSTDDPILLSKANEIHHIQYTGDVIQVKRFVRKGMYPSPQIKYQCLIWPKLGGGYTELSTVFEARGLEHFSWNRLDMLVAGYEHQFQDTLRYWRTRFVVIPTAESPIISTGPSGEKLNEEEVRMLGIEKLAEQFTKLRMQSLDASRPSGGGGSSSSSALPPPPVRFLPTTLAPALSVLDETLMEQLAQIHASGPLRKNPKSDRDIADMSLAQIAILMKEEPGLIKHHRWHRAQYPYSFVGSDLVSWLAKEFRDVSSRSQATEWGVKLFEQGLMEHCRGYHPFMDGHYFYRLKGDHSLPLTPNLKGWFKRIDDVRALGTPSSLSRSKPMPAFPTQSQRKKRLLLSQSMMLDIDPFKRSDQAESVLLHHDIIHNPSTVFHFELQWIGTTARLIEDQVRQWSRVIERYGLKLIEAYVMQISDIRERNAFQSCFPISLAVPPPTVPELEKRIQPDGGRAARYYFEYALLHKFDYVLDIEAQNMYSEQVDVVYSYRRSQFHYSQFVHRSGVAFVQVLDAGAGFLFLTNRLIGPGRMGGNRKAGASEQGSEAEKVRLALAAFCRDADALTAFYDEQLALLPPLHEEPPTLII